ncbi:hypothetical protein KPL76_10345 [Subtercola sp. PAMC28395]|uniref:hypothetical protein n=1 Tax=Subtercola sp. PAMC28395 TaxID=2846775 RepID=UPI001C0D9232|nr:hypothetical protein [Subtercola sp. PAMC28395]QWT23144.1 hypothetical protein KPL76_10345 [Subtercola sp. PAMC28395]
MLTGSLTLTGAAVLAAVAILTGCASTAPALSPSEPVPVIHDPTRLTISGSPVIDALYHCLTEHGWQVTVTDDGAIEASSATIPAEQYELYVKDTWQCNQVVTAEFPVDARQKNLLYEAELAERTCLQNHGYTVGEPPTLQTFLDEYDTHPWSAVAGSDLATLSQNMPESEWAAINRQCPQPVPGGLR